MKLEAPEALQAPSPCPSGRAAGTWRLRLQPLRPWGRPSAAQCETRHSTGPARAGAFGRSRERPGLLWGQAMRAERLFHHFFLGSFNFIFLLTSWLKTTWESSPSALPVLPPSLAFSRGTCVLGRADRGPHDPRPPHGWDSSPCGYSQARRSSSLEGSRENGTELSSAPAQRPGGHSPPSILLHPL